MEEIKCDSCQKVLEVGDFPFCPHPSASPMIASDDIPGGLEIRHGICNPDGTPRKYYSKSEIRKAAHEAGWSISGETPNPNQRIIEQRHKEAESKGRSWY